MTSYLNEDAGLIRAELPEDAKPPANSEGLFVIYAVLIAFVAVLAGVRQLTGPDGVEDDHAGSSLLALGHRGLF